MTCRSCVCYAVSRLMHCCAGRGCNGPRCNVFGRICDFSCVSTTELASQSETDVAVVVRVTVQRPLRLGRCCRAGLMRHVPTCFSLSLGIIVEGMEGLGVSEVVGLKSASPCDCCAAPGRRPNEGWARDRNSLCTNMGGWH